MCQTIYSNAGIWRVQRVLSRANTDDARWASNPLVDGIVYCAPTAEILCGQFLNFMCIVTENSKGHLPFDLISKTSFKVFEPCHQSTTSSLLSSVIPITALRCCLIRRPPRALEYYPLSRPPTAKSVLAGRSNEWISLPQLPPTLMIYVQFNE